MIKKLICFFNGHIKPTTKRKKEIKYAIMMYGYDCWGSDAFSNIHQIEKLKREYVSCSRCGANLEDKQ